MAPRLYGTGDTREPLIHLGEEVKARQKPAKTGEFIGHK